ncbi:MAG: carboxypeptidase-like regulatory domain-containing protein [Saprospiraceae bacterium]|nr:carboxypeptidase-like regulatory domain-containing protein [Saprospiraceae bacterium]
MKKQHSFYLIILLWAFAWLLALPACKKDEPRTVHIKGRVTEYGTGAPIADARIYMLCDNSVVLGPSGSSLSDSIITDSDGRFDRTYPDADLCGSLYLLPYKKGYFKGNEIDLTTDFKELNITLDPEAWLKIVTVPDLGGGGISFSGTFTGAAGWSTYPIDGIKTQYFTTTGNRIKFVDWAYWANPNATFKRDSIYLPAHDTTTYTIHY